jgi:hypothetical protein
VAHGWHFATLIEKPYAKIAFSEAQKPDRFVSQLLGKSKWLTRRVVTRPLAAVLLAVTVGSASPGGVLFRCRFEGLVRSACCCEHERSADERTALAQASTRGCCELLVPSQLTHEAVKPDPQSRVADLQSQLIIILSASEVWPTSPLAATTQPVWRIGPRGPDHPLFLQNRSLLI